MFVANFKGYDIYISPRENKKYMAIVNDKKIHFGDKRYQHYKDKLKHYAYLDHNDKARRQLYYMRHGLTAPKGTAKWFAHNILW